MTLSGQSGDDVKPYQERALKQALKEVQDEKKRPLFEDCRVV